MVHTLRLDNYSTTPRKLVLGTNSSFGTESIKIERGAGWDGLNLTATWHIPGREEPLRVALLDGDAMDVPPEVTKEAKDGVLVLAGLASGVQRASCNVEYLILEQAGVYGGTDAEPTPELAAQVLEATMRTKANAEAAAQDASEAKANANKAQQAAENAAADAAKAGPYAEAALNAQKAAEAARDTAISAGAYAENAANAAAGAMTAAAESASKAAASENAAAASAVAAAGSATQAEAQKTAAAKAASDAQGYMQTASGAASAANASAENAAGSKAAAEKAASDAQGYMQAARSAETAANESAKNAAGSKAAAASSATASANSATAAAASATTASAKATEAADSASAAEASEQAAAQAAEIAQSVTETLQPEVNQIKDDLYALAPAGAQVGQIFRVAQISEDGKYTMEPVDMQPDGDSVYELIETITVDEPIASIVRDAEPDGTPYRFRSILVDISGAESGKKIQLYTNLRSTGTIKMRYTLPNKLYDSQFEATIENGFARYFAYVGGFGGGMSQNAVIGVKRFSPIGGLSINGVHYSGLQKVIRALVIEDVYDNGAIIAGTKIEIYGVRS